MCSGTFFICRQVSGQLKRHSTYLAPSCVELQRSQVGVKDHVTGLDVDGRLPLPDGTQVPGWVHQTPEGWDWWWVGWGWGESKREREKEKNKNRVAVISLCAPQDPTVQKGSEPHYEGKGEVSLGEIWIYMASLEPDSNWNLQIIICQLNWGTGIGFIKVGAKVLLVVIHNWFPPILSNGLFKWNSAHLGAFDLICLI